jgi:hypothetical protein
VTGSVMTLIVAHQRQLRPEHSFGSRHPVFTPPVESAERHKCLLGLPGQLHAPHETLTQPSIGSHSQSLWSIETCFVDSTGWWFLPALALALQDAFTGDQACPSLTWSTPPELAQAARTHSGRQL